MYYSFVREEWSYLRKLEHPLDLPISDEIWENLDRGIIDKRVAVNIAFINVLS